MEMESETMDNTSRKRNALMRVAGMIVSVPAALAAVVSFEAAYAVSVAVYDPLKWLCTWEYTNPDERFDMMYGKSKRIFGAIASMLYGRL